MPGVEKSNLDFPVSNLAELAGAQWRWKFQQEWEQP